MLAAGFPAPATLAYRGYQSEGIAFLLAALRRGQPGVLLADDPGLGKTIMAAGLINAAPNKFRRVLVVCPATGKINWQRELEKWLVRPLRIGVWDGGADTKNLDVVITSYEMFMVPNPPKTPSVLKPIEADLYSRARKRPVEQILREHVVNTHDTLDGPELTEGLIQERVAVLKEAMAVRAKGYARRNAARARFVAAFGGRWDLVICDESKKVKNDRTGRTKTVLALSAGFHLFLDGTPIMNRTIELYPTLSVIDPEDLGRSKMYFGQKYCGAWNNGFGWQWHWPADLTPGMARRKAEAEAELHRKLTSGLMLRRCKEDVLRELPPKIRTVIRLEPDAQTRKIMLRQMAEWTRLVDVVGYDGAVQALSTGGGFDFKTLSADRLALAQRKIPAIVDHVEACLEEEDKVVLFAHHHAVLDALAQALAAHNPVRIDGRTSSAQRQRAVDTFQTDPACRVFIGGNEAAGELITLTAASLVVICELPWTMSRVTQIEDRLHRLGQHDVVRCHHLVFDGSLDCDLAQLIVKKQELATAVLDGRADHATRAAQEERGPLPAGGVPAPPAEPLTIQESYHMKSMLTIEGTPEELAGILAAINSPATAPVNVSDETPSPAAAEQPAKKGKGRPPKDKAAPAETPTPVSASKAPEGEVTIEKLRTLCASLKDAADSDTVKRVIADVGGADKLVDVPAANYVPLAQALAEELEKAA